MEIKFKGIISDVEMLMIWNEEKQILKYMEYNHMWLLLCEKYAEGKELDTKECILRFSH